MWPFSRSCSVLDQQIEDLGRKLSRKDEEVQRLGGVRTFAYIDFGEIEAYRQAKWEREEIEKQLEHARARRGR